MDILDQAKQSIEAKKYEHPTVTLTTTFHKPVGESNLYIQFGYILQIFSNTPEDKFQDQLTVIRSMLTNSPTINDKKMITKTPKTNT